MSQQVLNGVLALLGGVLIALVAFIPFAARRYRRAGRFGGEDLAVLLLGGAYALALWTYTLLPLPDPAELVCRDAVLRPFGSIDDIRAHGAGSIAALARNPAVLQVALNVALFVPLGFLLRRRARWGLAATALAGLGASLLIELTQLTGVWGLYDCAYRFFDVDDLIANTTGAVIGWIVARVVLPRKLRVVHDRSAVGRGRRLVGLVSDGLVFVVVGAVAAVGWRAWSLYGRDVAVDEIDLVLQAIVQWSVPLAIQAIWLLASGRTIGEWVVQIRAVDARGRASVVARGAKLLLGLVPVAALGAWDASVAGLGLVGLVVAHLVAALVSPRRGLTGVVARTTYASTAPTPAASSGGSSPTTRPPRST